MNERPIIVHSLEDAEAALAAAADLGVPVTLRSPPGAARYLGATAPSFSLLISLKTVASQVIRVFIINVLETGDICPVGSSARVIFVFKAGKGTICT